MLFIFIFQSIIKMNTTIIIVILSVVCCFIILSTTGGIIIYKNQSDETSDTPPSTSTPTSTPTRVFRPIKADAGGRCIDVPSASHANNVELQMYDCNGTDSQNWMYDSGTKAFKNAFGKCMDINKGYTNGTIQQYDCNNTAAQQWTTDSDKRIISGLDSSLCLSIKGEGNRGDRLMLYDCSKNGSNEHFNFA